MMRVHLAKGEKHYYKRQKQSAFIDAVDCYCSALGAFAEKLASASHVGVGGRHFIPEFPHSLRELQRLRFDCRRNTESEIRLAGIKYRLLVQGKRITVTQCEDEPDYRADVLATFEKFKEGAAKQYHFEHRVLVEMNHVEAAILDLVVQLFPEVFAFLDETRPVARGSWMTRSPDLIASNSILPVSSSLNL